MGHTLHITHEEAEAYFHFFSGIGLTTTGFGVMATGLVSLLSLSLSPELRKRVTNIKQLARVGAPAWSRR